MEWFSVMLMFIMKMTLLMMVVVADLIRMPHFTKWIPKPFYQKNRKDYQGHWSHLSRVIVLCIERECMAVRVRSGHWM